MNMNLCTKGPSESWCYKVMTPWIDITGNMDFMSIWLDNVSIFPNVIGYQE